MQVSVETLVNSKFGTNKADESENFLDPLSSVSHFHQTTPLSPPI